LQHARQLARQTAEAQCQKYKQNFNLSAAPHQCKIGQKVWLSDTTTLGKNPKLTPKWIGPYTIVDINDNNAKIETKPNKFKIINVTRLKAFQEELNKRLSQDDTCLSQDDNCLFEDNKTDAPQRPMTRALKKLIDFKNAAAMAVSFIESKLHDECDGNMFSENYNKYHCANCYHGIRNFAHFASQMDIF